MDVESAEALATLRAVRLAKDHHVRNIELETDSQILYNALKHPKPDLSFFGLILRDILSLRRVGNSVAYSLASLARTIDAPLFFLTLPNSCMDKYYADLQNY
ncbi:hypothetical protein ACS0TY_021247 [Phlomoides rotata]